MNALQEQDRKKKYRKIETHAKGHRNIQIKKQPDGNKVRLIQEKKPKTDSQSDRQRNTRTHIQPDKQLYRQLGTGLKDTDNYRQGLFKRPDMRFSP